MNDLLSFLSTYTKKSFSKPLMIILTIPHAKCRFPDIKGPENCDKVAKEMGELLFYKLKEITTVKKFVSDEYRENCDYNRYFCKKFSNKKSRTYDANPNDNKPGFRERITNEVKKYQGDYRIFVLDVHSYHVSKFGNSTMRKKVKKLDIYFLNNNYTSKIADNCNDFLEKKGIKTKVYLGKIGQNDIMDEMNDKGIENFLIEFNEDLKQKRKITVANSFVKWVKYYFNLTKIISPVSGIIDKVESDRIGIYIRGPFDKVQDDHNIYAPKNGEIKFKEYQGKIVNENFKSFENKRGKLTIYVNGLKTEIFVGKGYVTDNIKLTKRKKVNQGDWIGEIIINKHNSYAYVYILGSSLKIGSILYGGKSVLK